MKNTAEKYFKQKKWSILEIICVITAILSAIIATFVWGGGPIGLPLSGISIVILIISKSSKVHDADIDTIINQLVSDHVDVSELKDGNMVFDLRSKYCVKGKDGKIRSTNYVISTFSFENNATHAIVYRFDLLTSSFNKELYVISKDENVSLIEETVHIGGIQKTAQYLECSAISMNIPIHTDQLETSEIVKRLCKHEEK